MWFAMLLAGATSAHSRGRGNPAFAKSRRLGIWQSLGPRVRGDERIFCYARWFPIDLQVVNPGKGYLDVEQTK
jgi:hypothetical protein